MNEECIHEICKKCGCVTEVGKNQYKKSIVYDESGNGYNVIWYECEWCEEKNVVQIDSEYTLEIKDKLESLILEALKRTIKNESMPYNLANEKEKLYKRLKKSRKTLKKNLVGKKLSNENITLIVYK